MMKTRVTPILAGAAMMLSLGACQWMGEQKGSSPQTSSTAATSNAQTQQALSPDLVRDIQRNLNSRGYDAGPADGVYGETTQNALRNFQRDQRTGSASGQIDSQTLAALGVTGSSQGAVSQRKDKEYTPTSKRGASVQQERSSRQTAAANPQVRQAQQELADRGYDPGPVDGRMGPRTRQALTAFQTDQNLQTSGRLDRNTVAALQGEPASTQTGQLPEDMPQSEATAPEQSQLPPTGSEAPGSVKPPERSGGIMGNEGPETQGGLPRTPEQQNR